MTRASIIIDTDPGLGEPGSDIDDGLAIALALRSPELDVLGLTIVNGNVDLSTGITVARHLTDRLGRPALPVLGGAAVPLKRDMSAVRALFDAVEIAERARLALPEMGPTSDVDAAEWMVEQVAARPGEITIVAIGPLTNVARAVELSPTFARDVAEILMMAGSATTYAQNLTVVGDFNAYVDPDALDIVLRSGARVRMVGLDQTSQVHLTRTDAADLRRTGGEFAEWVAECTDAWIDFLGRAFPNRPEHRDACFLHDPLVIAAAIDPSICAWEEADVQVELVSDLARGLVVANRGLALQPLETTNATVAVATDVDRFRSLFLTRMKSPALT